MCKNRIIISTPPPPPPSLPPKTHFPPPRPPTPHSLPNKPFPPALKSPNIGCYENGRDRRMRNTGNEKEGVDRDRIGFVVGIDSWLGLFWERCFRRWVKIFGGIWMALRFGIVECGAEIRLVHLRQHQRHLVMILSLIFPISFLSISSIPFLSISSSSPFFFPLSILLLPERNSVFASFLDPYDSSAEATKRMHATDE